MALLNKAANKLVEVKPIKSLVLVHREGIPNIPTQARVEIGLFDDRIRFKQTQVVEGQYEQELGVAYLNYDQLIYYGTMNDLDAKRLKDGTIGNAVIGGLLFGGVGAIVGALRPSSREVVCVDHYFVMEYNNQKGEESTLVFSIDLSGLYDVFIGELKKHTNAINLDEMPNRYDPIQL